MEKGLKIQLELEPLGIQIDTQIGWNQRGEHVLKRWQYLWAWTSSNTVIIRRSYKVKKKYTCISQSLFPCSFLSPLGLRNLNNQI